MAVALLALGGVGRVGVPHELSLYRLERPASFLSPPFDHI
jgi:hypothetical protein